MTRAVALSDQAVIEELNKNFVSLEINLTERDFPEELSGLSLWEQGYERDTRYSLGFATSVVLGSDGTAPFGTSGCGHRGELETALNYDPPRFLKYLRDSRERFKRTEQATANRDSASVKLVRSEVASQLHEANRCKCRVKKELFRRKSQ